MCDQLDGGPKHPDCIKVAALLSIQVDFAKHSECVPKSEFEQIKKRVTRDPDYLQAGKKPGTKEVYESPHVLGQMYRDVDINKYYELCTRSEYH